MNRGLREKINLLAVGSNKISKLVFLENEGVVWLKDSAKGSENSFSLPPEDFEYDAIKKAHIEKDFIAFCSSTPGNECLYRTPLWALPIQKFTHTHTHTLVENGHLLNFL